VAKGDNLSIFILRGQDSLVGIILKTPKISQIVTSLPFSIVSPWFTVTA